MGISCFSNKHRRLLAYLEDDTENGYGLGRSEKISLLPITSADLTISNTPLFDEKVMNGRDGITRIYPNLIQGAEGKLSLQLSDAAFYYMMLAAFGEPVKSTLDTGIYQYEWTMKNIVECFYNRIGLIDNDGNMKRIIKGLKAGDIEIKAADSEDAASLEASLVGRNGEYVDDADIDYTDTSDELRTKAMIMLVLDGDKNNSSATGLDSATTYNLTLNAGGADITLAIDGSQAQTYGDLINVINGQTTDIKAFLITNHKKSKIDIRFKESASVQDAAVAITDTNNLATAMGGVWKTIKSIAIDNNYGAAMFWNNTNYYIDGNLEDGIRDIDVKITRKQTKYRLSGSGYYAESQPQAMNIEIKFNIFAHYRDFVDQLLTGTTKPIELSFLGNEIGNGFYRTIDFSFNKFYVKEPPKQTGGAEDMAIFEVNGIIVGEDVGDGTIGTAKLITDIDFETFTL